MTTDRLGPAERSHAISRLQATSPQAPVDVLVIGGGVVGCGAALDAASRGLSVGLVEMHDLASGTSSRSSRLAHGGLRYLEQREFGLVREALTERGLLLDHLAPHLVHPVPFLFPVSKRWERPYVASGVKLYDVMSRVGSSGGIMPKPKSVSREEMGVLAPDLNLDEISGGVTYYDAQINDARHTVAVARTAASYGAHIVTRTEVVALQRVTTDGDERVTGVTVRDHDGCAYDIHARVVISAAGVWSDRVRSLLGGPPAGEVRQSKGVHLVVPKGAIDSKTAIIARTPKSVLFLLPWGRNWLIGTTDTDWKGDLAEPTADDVDINYLIGQANRWLNRPLHRDDVIGVYAGLRPLVSDGDAAEGTTTLSREHAIFRPVAGFVQIAGGKYTTYRVMAADVVDAAVTELVALGHEPARESRTAEIPLVGAAGFWADWESRSQIAAESGLDVACVESLLRRHGGRIGEILDLVADEPSLGDPLVVGEPYLRAEYLHAGSHEGALTVEDTLLRRTRIALETRDQARSAAGDAARLLGRALGWDDAKSAAAAADYL